MSTSQAPIDLPADPDPQLAYVLLVTREAAYVEPALAAIAASHDRSLPAEVVVVLASPHEDTHALFAERALRARTLVAPEGVNVGLVVAWNLAMEATAAPLAFVMHEDTWPREGCARRLVQTLAEAPALAVLGTRQVDQEGGTTQLGGIVWRDGGLTSLTEADVPDGWATDAPLHVDFAGLAGALVPRTTWEAVGGFDERFFPAHYSDVDFCTSVRAAGGVVLVDPGAVVHHLRDAKLDAAAGAERSPSLSAYLAARQRRRYLAKWPKAVGRRLEHGDDPHAVTAAALERIRAHDRGRTAAAGSDDVTAAARPITGELLAGGEPFGDRVVRNLLAAQVELLSGFLEEMAGQGRELAAELDSERTAHARCRERLAVLEPDLEWALERARTLDQVEAGGWWRLRARLRRLVGLGP